MVGFKRLLMLVVVIVGLTTSSATRGKKTGSEFTFSDDEDALMLKDEASSGDGPEEGTNPDPEPPTVEEVEPDQPEEETKPDEPAVEETIPDEPSVEESNPEEPSVEEPNPEEPPVEETKPEEPSVEEPKPEEPSVEESNPEEPPVEETKPDEPSVEETNPEEPSVEEPNPEEPPVEETKPEEPSVEETNPEEPPEEETKPDEPSVEETNPEEPSEEVQGPPAVTKHPPKHPSGGHHSQSRPGISLPSTYLPTQVCGKKYYCRRGYRGPCHRNEIFTFSSNKLDHLFSTSPKNPTCAANALSSYGCFPSLHSSLAHTSHSTGQCRIRFPHKPCYGYPSNYRYCKQTKRCYPCQSRNRRRRVRGHCGIDKVFTPVDKNYGHCRCKRPNYVPCQKDRRCYPAYTRASCSRGQWLVPSRHGLSTCKASPCPSMADGRHIYWNGGKKYRPGCYKSHTRGPCRPGMYFKIDNFLTGEARCVYTHTSTSTHTSSYRKQQRPNLYSLLMDWPTFGLEDSLGGSLPKSPLNSNYYGYDDIDADLMLGAGGWMGGGNDFLNDMNF